MFGSSQETASRFAPPPKPVAEKKHDLKPQDERFIDQKIEFLLQERARFLNAGNNGVVFSLEAKDIDEETKAVVREKLGSELETDQAIKILKVYAPGLAEREFQSQVRASELMAQARAETRPEWKGKPFAKVPMALLSRDVALLNPNTISHLEQLGVKPDHGHVETIFMDLVPGKDLATIMAMEVIKIFHDPEFQRSYEAKEQRALPPLMIDVEGMSKASFYQLYTEMFRLLDLPTPSVQQRFGDNFAADRILQQNAAKIFTFLKVRGFSFHQSIVDQIENTMTYFNKHGFYFRDGHFRNFMVVGPYTEEESKRTGQEPQAYVIDYGNSIQTDGSVSQSEVYSQTVVGQEGKFPRDTEVYMQLKTMKEREKTVDDRLSELCTALAAKPKWPDYLAKVSALSPDRQSHFGTLVALAPNTFSPDQKKMLPLVLTLALAKQGTWTEERTLDFLKSNKSQFPVSFQLLVDVAIKTLEKK